MLFAIRLSFPTHSSRVLWDISRIRFNPYLTVPYKLCLARQPLSLFPISSDFLELTFASPGRSAPPAAASASAFAFLATLPAFAHYQPVSPPSTFCRVVSPANIWADRSFTSTSCAFIALDSIPAATKPLFVFPQPSSSSPFPAIANIFPLFYVLVVPILGPAGPYLLPPSPYFPSL